MRLPWRQKQIFLWRGSFYKNRPKTFEILNLMSTLNVRSQHIRAPFFFKCYCALFRYTLAHLKHTSKVYICAPLMLTNTSHLFGDLSKVCLYLSRLMTKPTMWLCAQQRLRSAWASAQSDQSLRCPCPGWSESSLGAHTILLVLSRGGSIINYTPSTYTITGRVLFQLPSKTSKFRHLTETPPLHPRDLC